MFKSIMKKTLELGLAGYKKRKRSGFKNSAKQALESAYRQVERSKYAFLLTHGEQSPDARLIEPIFSRSDFAFWIGTSPKSRKIAQVKSNSWATLAFCHQGDNANLIVKGSVELVDDVELRAQHWKPHWRLFFPAGPKGGDYILMKLNVTEIEVLDFSQSVVPEPFGLKPVRLERLNENWQLVS